MNTAAIALRITQPIAALERILVIETDSDAVAEYANKAFAPVRLHADSFSRPRDTGRILWADGCPEVSFNGRTMDFGSPAARATPFRIAFYGTGALLRQSLAQSVERQTLYAAGVRFRRRAILIAGEAQSGKTTLAIELVRRGAQFYGDEFTVVRRADKMVTGVPRTVMIRERTLDVINDARLSIACVASRARMSSSGERIWDFIDLARVFGDSVLAHPAPLGALIILDRTNNHRCTLQRIPASIAAADLVSRRSTATPEFAAFGDLAQLLESVHCYRLHAGPIGEAADVVSRTLDGAR